MLANDDQTSRISRKAFFFGTTAGFIIAISLAWLVYIATRPKGGEPAIETKIETTRKVYIDTLRFVDIIPRDSLVVRYETHKLPITRNDTDTTGHQPNTPREPELLMATTTDSVEVEIPITQRHYTDETFEAWVSGYRPQLDSIQVYPKTEVLTITETITEKTKPKRWGISLGAGATLNTKGEVRPGLFFGISYTILDF